MLMEEGIGLEFSSKNVPHNFDEQDYYEPKQDYCGNAEQIRYNVIHGVSGSLTPTSLV